MRIFFVLFLLLASFQSNCQSFLSGYIIKSNGDSSKVLIRELLPSAALQKCIVKEGKSISRYSSEDLSAYGYYGGNRYSTLDVGGRRFFAKILIQGRLSLYQAGGMFYVKEKDLVALDKSASSPNYFVNVLNTIIADCRLSAAQIGYTEKELTSIVQNYNRCSYEAGATFNPRLEKFAINYSFKAGYSQTTMNAISEGGFETSSTSQSVPIDLGIEFSLPRLNRNTFLTAGLVFEKNLYQFYDERKKYSTFYRRDVIFKLTTLKIPVGIKYRFYALNNAPYISAGISPVIFISKDQNVIEEKENGSTITTTTSNRQNSISQSGLWVGMGYTHGLNGKASLLVEAKYESTSGSIGGLNYDTSGKSLSLTIGIRY